MINNLFSSEDLRKANQQRCSVSNLFLLYFLISFFRTAVMMKGNIPQTAPMFHVGIENRFYRVHWDVLLKHEHQLQTVLWEIKVDKDIHSTTIMFYIVKHECFGDEIRSFFNFQVYPSLNLTLLSENSAYELCTVSCRQPFALNNCLLSFKRGHD